MRLGHPDGRPGNMHQAQRKSKYRNTLTLEEKIVCVHDESWAQGFWYHLAVWFAFVRSPKFHKRTNLR